MTLVCPEWDIETIFSTAFPISTLKVAGVRSG